ncbi:hypothetical protein [Streptomyces sp. NBC_00525]|uniref:hypothetical protein n=1 Tax=Streptomyces sp. NBC_00525 TaxID=2903660 RepID=UPI002E824062|nr:hypothetical protein [Streptomyces sp. NBC_00525]WUC94863.1 hypothetical protein OG710_15315 [Streptomyces sp. NBC_00525]
MYGNARTGAILTAGLLAAVMLTGCGSDGDKNDADAKGAGDVKSLAGGWISQKDGKQVVLSVNDGMASLVADAHVCTGSVKDADKPTLKLECADGDTARTAGTVESNDGKTLVIAWDGGTRDELKRAAAGVDLPDLPEMPDVSGDMEDPGLGGDPDMDEVPEVPEP